LLDNSIILNILINPFGKIKMEAPIPTSNTLLDIINWLKTGDIVILHNNTKNQKAFQMPDLKLNRKIYVNVMHMPDLLHEGEWPWYILNAKAVEISNESEQQTENTYSFSVPNIYL